MDFNITPLGVEHRPCFPQSLRSDRMALKIADPARRDIPALINSAANQDCKDQRE